MFLHLSKLSLHQLIFHPKFPQFSPALTHIKSANLISSRARSRMSLDSIKWWNSSSIISFRGTRWNKLGSPSCESSVFEKAMRKLWKCLSTYLEREKNRARNNVSSKIKFFEYTNLYFHRSPHFLPRRAREDLAALGEQKKKIQKKNMERAVRGKQKK